MRVDKCSQFGAEFPKEEFDEKQAYYTKDDILDYAAWNNYADFHLFMHVHWALA